MDGLMNVTAESVEKLTGITCALDEEAKTLTITLTEAEEETP